MKTFNDWFYDSENRRGFMETFESVDSGKLTELIGEHSGDDVRMYDTYMKSRIGFLSVSPLLDTIGGEKTSLQDRQEEAIRVFLTVRFAELRKVKDILLTNISVNNGVVRTEDKNTVTTSKNSVSAFNSDDMEDDNENNYNNETDNTITEQRNDVETTVRNIGLLTDFYKMSMIDRFIEYVKDLFTLQVVE